MTLPAKCQGRIQDSEITHYEPTDDTTTGSPAVRRAHIFTLRAPSSATVVWPREYLEQVELDIPIQYTSLYNMLSEQFSPQAS